MDKVITRYFDVNGNELVPLRPQQPRLVPDGNEIPVRRIPRTAPRLDVNGNEVPFVRRERGDEGGHQRGRGRAPRGNYPVARGGGYV